MKQRDNLNIKAKKQGFRARSVFKLMELNRNFRLIKKGDKVLDLGAFPGSWSQFASNLVGENGKVIAIDKLQINKIKNVEFIQADVMQNNIFQLIKEKCNEFDVVISDVAPETLGDKKTQQELSYELSYKSLEVALKVLKKNGNFLVKVFQSNDINNLVKEIKNNFWNVKVTRPIASKRHSQEMYIVAKNRKVY